MEETERFKVIEYLVQGLSKAGKVRLQKAAYFLQEATGVSLGYEFVMHYYGPYSFELDDTLTRMWERGRLEMTLVLFSEAYGYDISLGQKANAGNLKKEYRNKADKVIAFFKTCDAQTMELCATIHFVRSILHEKRAPSEKATVVKHVRQLKPKFSEDSIGNWFDRLGQAGFLQMSTVS